jgi:DNA-binding response OmpR family regulator
MISILDERTLGYSLGAAEFMTKPIDRARLVGLVKQFAGRPGSDVVLIVDDQPDVRDIVGQTIAGVGLKPAEAVNGQAALDWLAEHPRPALILLDLMMPVMDGRDSRQRAGDCAHCARIVRKGTRVPRGTHDAHSDEGRATDLEPGRGAGGDRST